MKKVRLIFFALVFALEVFCVIRVLTGTDTNVFGHFGGPLYFFGMFCAGWCFVKAWGDLRTKEIDV